MQQIGRYEILGELGRGGMGVVYLGRDPAIGRQVAIKTIRLQDATDAEEQRWLEQRLLREARSAGILSHPYIVTVHDVMQEDDVAYIVMEYVKETTLERRLQEEAPPSREFVLNTLRQTAMALDYAHRNGIVHRDIKPSNILIHQDGIAKITDFGVAKIMTTQQMTRSGSILGTPNYMSPEQLAGKNVDGRADQFSLAGIAYLMLTGETPYTADTLPALVYKIVHEDPAAPQVLNPTLGVAVEAVFRKAQARAAEGRYAACTEFIEALEAALASAPDWRPLRQRRMAAPRPASRTPVSGSTEPALGEAGAAATVVCQACEARLPFGARFCLVCGRPVGATPGPHAPDAPPAEAGAGQTPTPGPRTPSATLLFGGAPVRKRLMTSPTWEKELTPARQAAAEAVEQTQGTGRRRWPVWAAVVVAMGIAVALVYRITKSGGSPPDQTAQVIAPAATPKATPRPEELPAPPPKVSTEAEASPVERLATKKAGKESAGRARKREEPVPPPEVVKPHRPGRLVEEKKAVAPPLAQVTPPVEQPKAPEPASGATPPPVPQPSPPAEPAKPTAGVIVWTGVLERDQAFIISKGRYTTPKGTMSAALPDFPVNLTITPPTVVVHKNDSPGSVVLVNKGQQETTLSIHWTAK